MRKITRYFLILLSFVLFLLSIASWLTLSEYVGYNLGLSFAFLFCLCTYIIFDREKFKKVYEGSFFKNFVNASVGSILIFFILALLNYLAFKNPYFVDFTSTERNSLTDQTKNVLAHVPNGVKVVSLSDKQNIPALRTLLELYRYENKNLEIELYDGALRPDLISQHSVTKSPSMIISYDHKQTKIEEINELNITNAILKVTKGESLTVGWVMGHGELDPANEENTGGAYLKNLINGSNFNLKAIDLLQDDNLISLIDVLMILGPEDDYSLNEVEKISTFLKEGGALFVALAPKLEKNFSPFDNIQGMLEKFGVDFLAGAVIDNKNFVSGSNGLVPLVSNIDPKHIITRNFRGQFFLPLAQGVSVNDSLDKSFEYTFLFQSSDGPLAWLEKSSAQIRVNSPIYNENHDVLGPIAMSLAIDDKSSSMRIVAIGNSSFLQNSYKNMSAHFLFFLNSLNWLGADENLISFNLPTLDQEPIFVGNTELGLIFYFSVIFAPLILISVAFFFFQRRRRFN